MNKLLSENPYIRSFIRYSLPLFVIGIVSRTFPIISFAYFIVPVFLIIFSLMALLIIQWSKKNLAYLFVVFAFPLFCLITSLWSLNPFISVQRALYLLLIYAGILSLVYLNNKFIPEKGIGFLLPANIIVLALSAFSLISGIPKDSWTGGNGLGFMGFAGHQNTLAAALLFTLPGLLAYKIKDKGTKINVYSILYFLLLSFTLLLLIITYSRASILALAVGVITYLFITNSKKILAIIFSLTAVLIVLYIVNAPIQNHINALLTKDGGPVLARRMILWEPSIDAAKSGGVFGLGYGVNAPGIKTPALTGSYYRDGNYIREKGNSTLALIEETGLFGLFLFLLPVFWYIRKFIIYNSQFTIKEKPNNNYTLYIVHCTLISLFIHAQFEAWWVGVGSVQLPLYLIILFMLLYSFDNKKKAPFLISP